MLIFKITNAVGPERLIPKVLKININLLMHEKSDLYLNSLNF